MLPAGSGKRPHPPPPLAAKNAGHPMALGLAGGTANWAKLHADPDLIGLEVVD